MEDAAVLVILDLRPRIESRTEPNRGAFAIRARDRARNVHPWRDTRFQSGDIECLPAIQLERLARRPVVAAPHAHLHDRLHRVDRAGLGAAQGWTWFALLFVGGWIIQLVGHVFEGRKPALADNLFQIFVAPIFLAAEVFFALGYKPALHEAVQRRAQLSRAQSAESSISLTRTSS